jgi:hypothetical protein
VDTRAAVMGWGLVVSIFYILWEIFMHVCILSASHYAFTVAMNGKGKDKAISLQALTGP